MKNKVLIKIIFPEVGESFDIFIPVNEQIWKVSRLITKSIFDICGLPFDLSSDTYTLYDCINGKLYNPNEVVINTDIRNGSELLLIYSEG